MSQTRAYGAPASLSFRDTRGIPQVEGRVDGRRFDELTRVFSGSFSRKRFLALMTGIAAPAVVVDGLMHCDRMPTVHRR